MTEPRAHFELGVDQAQAIVDAVAAVRGVDSLAGGQFGDVSLFFPKKRIEGIRRPSPRDDSHIEIHVVANVGAGVPLADWGDAVRDAADGRAPNCPASMLKSPTLPAASATETDLPARRRARQTWFT